MREKLMDTQELSEIKRLIGEEAGKTPEKAEPVKQNTGDFNLNDILAEVSGVVDEATKEDHLAALKRQQQAQSQPASRPQSSQSAGGTGTETARQSKVNPQRPGQRTGAIPRVSQNTARMSRGTGRIPQGTGRVPQVSGRIPRIPGVDPREVEESLRATADEQARHLAELASEEYDDEPRMSRRERKKREKARRAEKERELDREEEIEIRNPREAQRFCKRRAKNLARRSVFVLILGLIALYITVASGMGLPLPSMLQYADHAYLTIMTLMIIQFLSMFIGLDVVGNGMYNLFKLRPDRSTLVVFSLVASLVHGMTIILFQWSGWLPYCAVSILLLFAQMQEEKARVSGRYRAYKAAALSECPMGVYAHQDGRDHVRRAVKYRMPDLTGFLREMERNDKIDNFERVYAPLAIVAAFVFAAVSSFGTGDPTRFCWALSAILAISAPFGILCAFGAPYRNVSRKLLTEGAALASARQAEQLHRVKQAVLRDGDLFPAGSITVDEIVNFGSYSEDKLLAYAAAVASEPGLEVGRVLSEALREKYGRPVRATNVTSYESGGLSADIGADSVLVGTSAFLTKLGIHLHGAEDMNIGSGIYVVINSQVAGEIKLTYHAIAQTYGALHGLRRLKIKPMIAAQDFSISPSMVESMFEVKHGIVGAVDPSRIPEINNPRYAAKDHVCAILSKDGAIPYTMVQQAADKLVSTMRTNLVIGTIAGVCGMALMFYLTFKGAAEAVEPKNVLLYLLLWYVPVWIVNQTSRRIH